MILRPVNPQSPIGPPITNRPVGFTKNSRAERPLIKQLGRQHRSHHVLPEILS